MGAWSHDAFGNDQACDWAYGLDEVDDLSLVEAAIAAVADEPAGYLDADRAVEALAAIEVIARLRGHDGYTNSYTERVDDWVSRTRLTPPDGLVQRALAALDRVLGDESELKELWSEGSDGPDDWVEAVTELRQRLVAAPVALSRQTPDAISKLVRQAGDLRFVVPALPPDATVNAVYGLVLAADALRDAEQLREGVARLWQAVERLGKENLLWDLAVREAKTWAAEGRLDAALAELEPWRDTAAAGGPGVFDSRVMSICQAAGAYERAEQARGRVLATSASPVMQRLDKALLEARAGAPQVARDILAAEANSFDTDTCKPWVALSHGILATRDRDPSALDLLTPQMQFHVDKCLSSPAHWFFGAVSLGWWALALHQAGRSDDARAVLTALRPVLLHPENRTLVEELQSAGLLGAADQVPALPASASQPHEISGAVVEHGVFRTVAVRGVNALRHLEAFRRKFAQGSRVYPFLIGDRDDLQKLLDMIEPPVDGGRQAIEAAQAVDAPGWLAQHAPKSKPRWPKVAPEVAKVVSSQFEVLTGRLKAVMFIGLIELDHPSELFARLGFGGWNECPAPEVHTAVQRYWWERFGAEPLALSGDVVECLVARPPVDRDAALALAREQTGYCLDIVEQGVGSAGNLAATLLEAPVWYFWWD